MEKYFSNAINEISKISKNIIKNITETNSNSGLNLNYKIDESEDFSRVIYNFKPVFKDTEFPANDSSLYKNPNRPPMGSVSNIIWSRIKKEDHFSDCIYLNPNIIDFKQGKLGAAMAVLIEKPFFLKEIFLNKKSGLSLASDYVGRYHVKLWYKGK